MAGIRLDQPGGVGTINEAGAQHPAPVEVEEDFICQLSFTGTTASYRWFLSKPSSSSSVLSSTSSSGPSFIPDVDGGSYSITLIDADENPYVLDILTPTSGGGGGGGGGGSVVTTINTYSDARAAAFGASTPAAAMIIQCRSDVDDGGGGLFAFDSGDTTTADNDGTVLVNGEGHRFKRIDTAALNVKWFGAKGDVVDAVGTDDTDAINATYVEAGILGRDVHFPAGVYKVTAPLTVPPGIRTFGDGWDSSIIYYTGIEISGSPGSHSTDDTEYILFNVQPNVSGLFTTPKPQKIVFEHLQICGDNGPSDVNPDGVFIEVDGPAQSGHTAIYINELGGPSAGVYVLNCKIQHIYSFAFRSDGNGTRKVIKDCYFFQCAGNCNPNGRQVFVTGNHFEECWGVEVAGTIVDISHNFLYNMIFGGISVGGDGGYADGEFLNDYDATLWNGAFNTRVCDNIIDGVFTNYDDSGGTALAFGTPVVGALISGNQISRCAQHAILQSTAFTPPAITPSYCVIERNIINSIGGRGIWIGQGGTDCVIRGNKIAQNEIQIDGYNTLLGISLASGLTDRFVVTDNDVAGWATGYQLDNCKNVLWERNTYNGTSITPISFDEFNGAVTFRQDGFTQTVSSTGSTNVRKLTQTVDVTANGATTVVLPSPVDMGARWRTTINNASSQLGTTTIDSSAGTIDGAATITLVGAYQSVTVESDGTNWRIVSQGRQPAASVSRVIHSYPSFDVTQYSVDIDLKVTASSAVQRSVSWAIEIPDGATLNTIAVKILPVGGHGGLPATMPQIKFRKYDVPSATGTVSSATVDSSADVTAYQLAHSITKSSIAEVINNATNRYFVQFECEGDANAILGTEVLGITVTFTTTTTPDIGAN